jgi:hypothetical protein
MFLTELTPAIQELTHHPVAFLGGFFSGMFHLKLDDEPLKGWLERQGVDTHPDQMKSDKNGSGPQSISID